MKVFIKNALSLTSTYQYCCKEMKQMVEVSVLTPDKEFNFYIASPSNIINNISLKYCPFCGKKIKIIELTKKEILSRIKYLQSEFDTLLSDIYNDRDNTKISNIKKLVEIWDKDLDR